MPTQGETRELVREVVAAVLREAGVAAEVVDIVADKVAVALASDALFRWARREF